MRDYLPKLIPTEALSFISPRPGENFFTRKMSRRSVLTTAATVGASITVALTEGPKIAAAAALAKPRTQELPPPDPTASSPDPDEGEGQLSPAEQWISAQRIADKATLINPITGLERDVVNVRTEDTSQEITINPQTKQALAEWGADMMRLHEKTGMIDLVFGRSIANSPYPNETSWGNPTKQGALLDYYRGSPSAQSLQFLVILPPDYSAYAPDLQQTVRANIAGNFLNYIMLNGDLRMLSQKEAAASERISAKLDYRNLINVSPVQSTQ